MLVFAPVLQEKTPSLTGVRQHPTGNNISARSHTFMPVNLAFGVSSLYGNPTPLVPETQSATTQRIPARLLLQCCGWKTCQQQLCTPLQTNCSFTCRKCQQALSQTNMARLRPVTSPGEHLPASALRSSGADLGLTSPGKLLSSSVY